jgi:Holliday junction resolvase RusA-like endonuclease
VNSISLRLPLPPTTNNHSLSDRKGTLRHGPYYAHAVSQMVARAARHAGWAYPAGARLTVTMIVHLDRRGCDLDNRAKYALDAVSGGLGFRDEAVDELILRRGSLVEPGQGYVVVTVRSLATPAWELLWRAA